MISSTLKVVGCLFVVCLVVNAQNPAQKTRAGSISGKVTLKGNAVAGILVGAREERSGGPDRAPVTTTDQQGNYRLSNVGPGHYQVMVVAPQYVLTGSRLGRSLIVADGENIENVDFALVRGGVITGKVIDADGRPVVEEPVEVLVPEGSNTGPVMHMSPMSYVTDDRGIYRIYGLAPGKYRVAAGASQDGMYFGRGRGAVYSQTFYPSTTESVNATLVEVTEGSEATNVDITLRRTMGVFTVTARIIDAETGKPIPDARYGLEKFRENGSSATGGLPANKQGEIKLENMTPGKYAIYLEPSLARDVYSEPLQFEVVDQDIKDLVIKASSGSSVSGVIVFEGLDEKSKRINRAGLMIFAHTMHTEREYGGNSSPQSSIVGANGSFRVGGLRPGTLFFSIWNEAGGPTLNFEVARVERDGVVQPTLEIKPREQVNGLRLTVRLRSGGIRGVLKFENGQIPTSRVRLSARKIGDENYETPIQVDERGRFQSEPLPAGVYELRVVAYVNRGRPAQMQQQVVVVDNQVSEVTLTLDLKSQTGP
jgi:protocatechuate 3,4-dioxygenase beta subunit